MRGRVSTAGDPGAPRRERMRGRLGIGTEGVCGRWHGPGMLAGWRWSHDWAGIASRRATHGLRQVALEPQRGGCEDEVRAGGERPEQQRPVLEEEPTCGGPE